MPFEVSDKGNVTLDLFPYKFFVVSFTLWIHGEDAHGKPVFAKLKQGPLHGYQVSVRLLPHALVIEICFERRFFRKQVRESLPVFINIAHFREAV